VKRLAVASIPLFSVCALVLTSCSPADIGKAANIFKRTQPIATKGAKALRPLTLDEEKELGGTVACVVISKFGVVRDRAATDYVNHVAVTVASYRERASLPPRVLILNTDMPNAFACPGGYMFVTRGLLKLCRDESELAGVLGHEFTHVSEKHTMKKLKTASGTSFVVEAGTALAGQDKNALVQGLSKLVDKVAAQVLNNNHGREAEVEADLTGAEIAAMAGYDGEGLGRLVERMPATGPTSAWKENFGKYKSGETRGQMIRKVIEKKGLGGGARNAARYKRELARILGS